MGCAFLLQAGLSIGSKRLLASMIEILIRIMTSLSHLHLLCYTLDQVKTGSSCHSGILMKCGILQNKNTDYKVRQFLSEDGIVTAVWFGHFSEIWSPSHCSLYKYHWHVKVVSPEKPQSIFILQLSNWVQNSVQSVGTWLDE